MAPRWFGGSLAIFFLSAMTVAAQEAPKDWDYPLAVATSSANVYFVADRNLPGIWKVENGKIELFFQGQKQFRTLLNAVRCLAVDKNGNLLAGDSATREIYRFENGSPKPLTNGALGIPTAIAVGPAGEIYVADLEAKAIWKLATETGAAPEKIATIQAPRGLFCDRSGKLWVVCHDTTRQVVSFGPNDEKAVVVSERPMSFPSHIVVDSKGVMYVADGYSQAIWRKTPDGPLEKWVEGAPLVHPVGLALDQDTPIVIDPRAKALFRLVEKKLEVVRQTSQ